MTEKPKCFGNCVPEDDDCHKCDIDTAQHCYSDRMVTEEIKREKGDKTFEEQKKGGSFC